MLVDAKGDLAQQREVSFCEGAQLANKLEVPFLETSALEGTNVDQAFALLAALIGQTLGLSASLGVIKG